MVGDGADVALKIFKGDVFLIDQIGMQGKGGVGVGILGKGYIHLPWYAGHFIKPEILKNISQQSNMDGRGAIEPDAGNFPYLFTADVHVALAGPARMVRACFLEDIDQGRNPRLDGMSFGVGGNGRRNVFAIRRADTLAR